MEPDFDKLLSNKIRQAEQQPVSWNKHGVWEALESQTGTKRPYYLFHSVAAAMILVLIYFAVELTPGEIEPRANDTEVKSWQKTTERSGSALPENNKESAPAQNRSRQSTPSLPVAEITNSDLKTSKSVPHETKEVEVVIEPVLVDIQIDEEPQFSLPEEITGPEKKIRPIVGVITESNPENIANAKRKKPLRKLKSSDPMPWEDPSNALVFFVKK